MNHHRGLKLNPLDIIVTPFASMALNCVSHTHTHTHTHTHILRCEEQTLHRHVCFNGRVGILFKCDCQALHQEKHISLMLHKQ